MLQRLHWKIIIRLLADWNKDKDSLRYMSNLVLYSCLRFRTEWNGPFHSGWNGMTHFIPVGMEWPISIQPEWNYPFLSGRNGMAHSIPAGMNCFIPAGMEWTISFRPEWNVHSVDANTKYAGGGQALSGKFHYFFFEPFTNLYQPYNQSCKERTFGQMHW